MMLIGGVIQLYCNYRYKEPKKSYLDASSGNKDSLGFFKDQDEKYETQQLYRSKNYAKSSEAKSLNDIAFNYVNAEGVSRFREVDVKSFDGQYIQGYCHSARKFRTFRIDRIEGYIIIRDTGESMDPYEWAGEIEA